MSIQHVGFFEVTELVNEWLAQQQSIRFNRKKKHYWNGGEKADKQQRFFFIYFQLYVCTSVILVDEKQNIWSMCNVIIEVMTRWMCIFFSVRKPMNRIKRTNKQYFASLELKRKKKTICWWYLRKARSFVPSYTEIYYHWCMECLLSWLIKLSTQKHRTNFL